VGWTLYHTSRGLRPPDLLIAFSLLFPPHTRLPLYHHSSCNKIIIHLSIHTWNKVYGPLVSPMGTIPIEPTPLMQPRRPAAGVSAPCRLGIRSLGSIPRPEGSSRGGSSSLWSLSKLHWVTKVSVPINIIIIIRARWGQFRSNQLRSSGVCPVGPLRPQRAHWCRSLRGTNGACGDPTGG
jgi:hypothetical protein